MSSSRTVLANAIRILSMEAVLAANSGHPGAPMGLADVAEVLWRDLLSHNPADPEWINRDRFVLSNGHGSMLLYSLLHLTGYDLSLQDLKDFRQLHSKTAGHPEYGECPGVETTTGPLGQGLATAVGMALAEKKLGQEFNTAEFNLVDHRTWVIVGDGCLMEGISHEAASLAGTLALGKLICIYDDNGISIDGEVEAWFSEDVAARFEAYGWRVIRNVDGHDEQEISNALANASKPDGRPTLVCCKTTIGFGSPNKQGTAGAHGSVLGREEIELTKAALGWADEGWHISDEIYQAWDQRSAGEQRQQQWQRLMDDYTAEHPKQAAEFIRRMNGDLPKNWQASIQSFAAKEQQTLTNLETRKSSQACISAIAAGVPEMFGGSADLTGSNNTRWAEASDAQHMSYGVREFGMSAISNGILLHGGYRPFTGTFLIFMEYARNAVRLAALMKLPNIFVYTHDSVAVGEDGPTHQPVEQITNLRTTPNLTTWRPCDTVESAFAWQAAIASTDSPTALIFTRQKTVAQARDQSAFDNVHRGGYILRDTAGDPDAIVIATGSEVELAVAAAESLSAAGVQVRVVSMPCVEVFLTQSEVYKEDVLPNAVRARVAVEAGHADIWHRFIGLDGAVVGISCFGMSAPGAQVLSALGISAENVAAQIKKVIAAIA
jgi:transketolase